MQLANYSKITVYGVPFLGVEELIYHFLEGEPKNGVYVGGEREAYPCFGSEDWQYENRFYWNFVFARDPEELKAKAGACGRWKDVIIAGSYARTWGRWCIGKAMPAA